MSKTYFLSICIIGNCDWYHWFVGGHMLLNNFGSYVVIPMNVFTVVTVVIVTLFRDFGP
jgi:hypothetical protein